MNQVNQELITEAKGYIDRANVLDSEEIHQLFADDAVVDNTGPSGQLQNMVKLNANYKRGT